MGCAQILTPPLLLQSGGGGAYSWYFIVRGICIVRAILLSCYYLTFHAYFYTLLMMCCSYDSNDNGIGVIGFGRVFDLLCRRFEVVSELLKYALTKLIF